MKRSFLLNVLFSNLISAFALLSLTVANAPAQVPCVETNGVKVIFPPNADGGLDVLDSVKNIVLADDFPCTTMGPISDIHIWGSWSNNVHATITNFWLAIYSDVPAGTNFTTQQITNSHPGNLLWQQSFVTGQFAEITYGTGSELFFDPTIPAFVAPDSLIYYYCFYPTNPFVQGGSPNQPTNYWLVAYAQFSVPATGGQPTEYGWKSTTSNYNDPAVWGNYLPTSGLPVGNWQSMTNIQTQLPINLAFKLTTPTNSIPPVICVETNGIKFENPPQTAPGQGFDVKDSRNSIVLADDFPCNSTGPITDIHVWGSWLNDQVGTITNFWIGIYNDVPATGGGPVGGGTNSHPGTLLWYQDFSTNQFALSIYTNASEYFYNPTNNTIMGSDDTVWYYCFYPTNPFVQRGSPTQPTNYWLAIRAQLSDVNTNIVYGWKSSASPYNDPAVWGTVAGGFPVGDWQSMTNPFTQQPLDLSMKLTTPTNHCNVPIICAPDKTVECGSSWTFDPPNVGPDPCCTMLPTNTLTIITNTTGPCNASYTGIWTITDCTGVIGTCTQNVLVLDTTPPVITCVTNKSVECGTAWTFDTPNAVDACCGTNVTVTVFSTITNNPACPLVVQRTWKATDCCSNSSFCSQSVTVVDTTPPAIFCPTNMIVATCLSNITVFWSVTATDGCSGVTITSTPPSGFTFLAHTTNTVNVVAYDACGNTNTCSFTVTIVRPPFDGLAIKYFYVTNSVFSNYVVLSWTNGILQMQTNSLSVGLETNWVDVIGATSPYTNKTAVPLEFYRLRCY
jgi:hypothetical protein